jgi:hypothetical protein
MYRQRFDSDAFVSQTYRKRIEELVKAVCARYSLGRRKDALLTREVGDAGSQAADWPGSGNGRLPFSGSETWVRQPRAHPIPMDGSEIA